MFFPYITSQRKAIHSVAQRVIVIINPVKTSSKNISGFTLVEVLVALFIFATVSVMAFGGLSAVLKTRNAIEENADRMAELQKGMRILQRDIEQAISRPVRDEFGEVSYGLSGNSMEGILKLTRTGRINPLKLKRSSLQRLHYALDEDAFVRTTWVILDGATEETRRDLDLFSDVKDFNLRFLSADGEWSESWPADESGAGDIGGDPGPPKAVEVTLELMDFGEITRLFAVAGAMPSS